MADCTPTPEYIRLTTADSCLLQLRRHAGTGKAVLLVHGASAGSDTFRIGERQSLVDYLLARGFDVWTLDWRASMRCALNIYCTRVAPTKDPTIFTIDAAAANDIPAAISCMRQHYGVTGPIGIVGHCLGGGIVAQGIAQGSLPAEDVDSVVLVALGLFYKAAIDNIVKAEDHVLEALLTKKQYLLHPRKQWKPDVCQLLDPGDGPWDPLLEDPYTFWSTTPLRHNCNVDYCHRLSYMFGMPYAPDLIPDIHAHHLPSQFGYIPVQFLLHCVQNLRRGYAAPYENLGNRRFRIAADATYLNHEAFKARKITLITGDLNSLWHRDSIDTMYEWLRRGPKSEQPLALRKYVLPGYAHQDLQWGIGAPTDVFPRIAAGLSL